MKISMQSAAAGYLNTISNNTKGRQASVNEAGRNFDSLTISNNPKEIAEEQLKTAAKKEVMKAVYQPQNSSDKVAALKEQIAQGMYKIDPDAIASKMIFFRGDE